MIPSEDIPGHIIETIDITTGVLHDALTPVIIIPTMTPHITDCLHTGAPPLTLRIRADHIPIHDKRNPRVMIDNPQTDFYSSDDNSSDSGDDPDHLN